MVEHQLPTTKLMAYAAPIVPVSILHAPALSVLPALFAKHAGIDIALIGLILIVARGFDAITDPLIGFFSDRTNSPFGRRKPWILGGALLCSVAVYFQFRPGPDTGALYFIIWSFALYLGWTLMEIPHSAWLSELTHDYDEKTRIAGFRAAAGWIGTIIFTASPLLPIFATTEMTPEVTAFVSWVAIVLILPLTLLALWRVPKGKNYTHERPKFKETMVAVSQNRPFRIFFSMTLLASLSSGMVGGLYFFFMDAYLGILANFAHVGLTVGAVSLAATFIWPKVINRLEKHRAMALCNATVVLTLIGMAFIRPGPLAFPLLATIFGMSAFFAAGSAVASTSLLADVVDYDIWKTEKNRAGNYFAFLAFSGKFGLALGGGVGLFIVGMFGFNANGGNDALAMSGFYLTFLGLPILLNTATVVLALRFPLDRAQQVTIRKEIQERAESNA